jgi:hypothetical protein
MTDKTREDFEAWARANKPELLMQFVHGEPSTAYKTVLFYWQAATQQSAARIAALEAEVLALRKDAERWRTFLATRPANTHAAIIQAIDDAAVRKGGGV